MPKIIKPRTLGFLSKTERLKVGASYIVTALGMFDLARPDERRFESEQALWLMAAKALPKGAVLDAATPKPCAEMLVGGAARPVGGPASAMLVEWTVGSVHKRLVVSGDRNWRVVGSGAVATEPKPFTEMPIGPEQAFGGAGHADNPNGKGFAALDKIRAGELAPLPNVELADRLVRSLADQPEPALVGPIDPASKKKLRYAGTYDSHWLKNVAPAMPEDVDPRFFLSAPEDQLFPGYLAGGEPYHLRGFSGEEAELRGALPAFRVRCFLARKGEKDGEGELVEIAMRTDTLWLVAGARRGVLIYRGALPVQDIDAEDISETMLAYERAAEEPRSFGHYAEVWRLRRDRKTAFKYAFAESQLAPALPPEVVARRAEERAALSREKLDKHYAAMDWAQDRQMDKANVPAALRPAPRSQRERDMEDALLGLSMPTPEESAEGEIDLAALLDSIETIQKKVQEKQEETRAKYGAVKESFDAVRKPGADASSVDALFAALDNLANNADSPGESTTARVDAAISDAKAPPSPLMTAVADSGLEAEAALEPSRDWRQMLLDGLGGGAVDEEKEFAAARDRFLDLPESKPLAGARDALEAALGRDFGAPASDQAASDQTASSRQPARNVTLDALLEGLEDGLANPTAASQSAITEMREKAARANEQLLATLPNLSKEEGSPLEALLAAVSSSPADKAAAGDPAQGAQTAATDAKAKLEQAASNLDDQEAKMIAGIAQMRRMAAVPIYPQQPMTPSLARRFGEFIVSEHRAGLSLRGRDLAGADLSGVDLSGADLEGALMERANLTGARLAGARLVEAALTGATLDGADLSDADLSKANLSKCHAHGADFTRCRFTGPIVLEADFSGSKFRSVQIDKLQILKSTFDSADFSGAKLAKTQILRCSLKGAVWDGADLESVPFMESPLPQARFRGARLFRCLFLKLSASDSDFEGADVTRSAFVGEVDLTNARFVGATGAESTFHETKLTGANFERGSFSRATFMKADLNGANFRLATLKGAILDGAKLAGADLVGANLLKAQLRRADLSGARLVGADLYGANLDHTILTAADLTGVNLTKTLLAVDSHVG